MDLLRRFGNALNPSPIDNQQWKVELSQEWDILGPFPIHAREQHYLSPSFPLDLSEPMDFDKLWPSSYADGGRVAWGTAKADIHGCLKVSFPDIRWESLRATEGWAALQHHAVLRTSLTVYPPASVPDPSSVPYLLIHLLQGSYFTILPSTNCVERWSSVPEWYSGNIYDMEHALPRVVNLPIPPSLVQPTKYDFYVSGDYEIRIFGDPKAQGRESPVQTIRCSVEIQLPTVLYVREPSQDVICDFVDGIAFGDALGIGIRSISGWWTVIDVAVKNTEVIKLSLQRKSRISPSQMRIVPLHISQTAPFHDSELQVEITMASKGMSRIMPVVIRIRNLMLGNASAIRATYFYEKSMATAFIAIPPSVRHTEQSHPPILALHGAGVDIFEQKFWTDSLPQNKHSWLVVPSGRTSWGLDWHGPSAKDAWSTVDALASLSERVNAWRSLHIDPTKVIILGHSNGGQGAWYLASRYPDRVLGVVPAAAYIKSQAYVPLTMSRSAHFIDPLLRAILESSLTPDDNDLHLSNLVNTPVLAIHGGDDENVPVWHSREAVSILKTWSPDANATFHEDLRKGHWFPSIFDNERVQKFLDLVADTQPLQPDVMEFTLTVCIPNESGSLHGWKIESLSVPGRVGRLRIKISHGTHVSVVTSNVHTFSVDRRSCDCTLVADIDHSSTFTLPPVGITFFASLESKLWQVVGDEGRVIQPPSRLQQILSSCDPIVFIVPDAADSRELSVALRIAHDLNVHHRLDAEIVLESEALPLIGSGPWSNGNIVYIGKPSSIFVRRVLEDKKTSFGVTATSALGLQNQALDDSCSALFLHPHPSSTANEQSAMLFMISSDMLGLERLARLFPIRTGVTVPSWVVLNGDGDHIGAAGIRGAGVWGRDWKWNEALAWYF